MVLAEELRDVSKKVRSNLRHATNEDKTKDFLLVPFLKALGFDTSEPEDVDQQISADFGSGAKRVDLALLKHGKRIILIELKKSSTTLSDSIATQLRQYFNASPDVPFGVITNGVEYRFYSDFENPNIMDPEPFLQFNVLKFHDAHASDLTVFVKSAYSKDVAKSHALGLRYKFALRRALEQELQSPSDDLVKLLIKKVRPELKHVGKKVMAEMSPIVKEIWGQITHSGQGGGIPPPPPPPRPPKGVQQFRVVATYRGQRLEATLLFDNENTSKSRIKFDGELLSIGKGAEKAIWSINPDKPNGPNGWIFWKYRDPNSHDLRIIGDLRT